MGANTLMKLSEQGKVLIFFSDLNVVDLLVAEFRASIEPAISHIIALLSHRELKVRRASADALLEFSDQGNILTISTFLT